MQQHTGNVSYYPGYSPFGELAILFQLLIPGLGHQLSQQEIRATIAAILDEQTGPGHTLQRRVQQEAMLPETCRHGPWMDLMMHYVDQLKQRFSLREIRQTVNELLDDALASLLPRACAGW